MCFTAAQGALSRGSSLAKLTGAMYEPVLTSIWASQVLISFLHTTGLLTMLCPEWVRRLLS